MVVVKRYGGKEPFSEEKLVASLMLAHAPDPELIASEVENASSTQEVSDKVQLLMLNLVPEDLAWHDSARNYLLFSLYKQVWGKGAVKAINEGSVTLTGNYRSGFREWFREGRQYWDEEMAKYYEPHLDELAKYIDPSRDFMLTYNGVRTLMSRYLLRRLDGTIFEAPQYMWMRTAMGVAYAEKNYGGDPVTWAIKFYDLISQLKFLPNSPTLYNAFTRLGQLSACFVIPVDDCLSKETNKDDSLCEFGIMDALKLAALIFQSGGGVGYQFGKIRPEGDVVKSTGGVASGPLSFMRLFDTLVDTIKQGGKRRGAQMGMLFWWHPDVEKFITAKSGSSKDTHLQNFNISVTIDDFIMEKLLNGVDEDLYLINPRECPCLHSTWGEDFKECYGKCVELVKQGKVKVWKTIKLSELWGKIVESAWDSGDPGIWNKDTANTMVGYRIPGRVINATNPCGEEALYDFESCNLGSINLAKYVDEEEKTLKWGALAEDVMLAVRLLDDVIDVNRMPDERLRRANLASRRIGLGVNGLADILITLGLRYDSPEAVAFADLVANFVVSFATYASAKLAEEKGSFSLFNNSQWKDGKLIIDRYYERMKKYLELPEVASYFSTVKYGYDKIHRHEAEAHKVIELYGATEFGLRKMVKQGIRNGSLISIAPEGSRSLIAGVNSSIEPLFAIAYVRNLTIGKLIEYNLTALKLLKDTFTLDPGARKYIEENGTLPHSHPLANLLRTAHEIDWRWHVYMQVTWAKWSDSGVSKTINMPSNATKGDVDNAFKLAWLLGAYGVTVYRDQSKSVQVIYTGTKQAQQSKPSPTSLSSLKEKLQVSMNDPPEETIEDKMKRELGETDDPYCNTGSCG